MPSSAEEREWLTRKTRVDPRLDAAGWPRLAPSGRPHRTEEEETANGPADYALWLDGHIAGVVEAKKVTLGPQNVLTQSERYARGIAGGPHNFAGIRAPFLYSTNGEVVWFHDARHPLNRSRRIAAFHTPGGLQDLLSRDFDAACGKLLSMPNDQERVRPYQREANEGIEKAIAERKRHLLVAMATGTGKTFTMVNEAYRLLKSGVARRILFLVDRRALAAQAVRAFAAFEAEPGRKFDQIYEVYSSRFQHGDFAEEEKFDPKLMPTEYLTDPQPGHVFVYVCTIQRMAINLLGRQAIFGLGEDSIDEDADRLDIPIHAFDTVIADECHRGYTAAEVSVWRDTLDHFDAIKIGLTATPASHTTAYFQHKAFEYPFDRAVRQGYLVDYDVVNVRSEVRVNGVFLHEGEHVEVVDPNTGLSRMDTLEDERQFDTAQLEAKITAPVSNRMILEEVRKYALEHEKRYGRFPKTLVFAVNDLPHTSHSDQLVDLGRDVFARGDAFVAKVTGRVDRPLQRIREFRNRPNPAVVVTVDLLTTGVDIPDLEFLVFLRPVRSRILFEQMLGRGTRRGEQYSDKSHFTVFDCFDGTLIGYFREATGITAEGPDPPTRTLKEIIEEIWNNRDRDYNTRCLVRRLQRIDKEMAAEARPLFAVFVPEGDLGKFARALPRLLEQDFVATMTLLRKPEFQDLLLNYPRPERVFLKAPGYTDSVTSSGRVKDFKPEDYLAVFARFVQENATHVESLRILLDRPREWSAAALRELRQQLLASRYRFTVEDLQRAHEMTHHKALVDIISMVKYAANEEQPLLTATERVERALVRVAAGQRFTPEQQQWLDRVREVLRANLSIDREDFDYQHTLTAAGGWGAARRAFGDDRLIELIRQLNEAIAA
jgi:type I restriction enzyme R subunit